MEKEKDFLFFIFMSSFWAFNYPFVKMALAFEDASVLLLYRVIFAIIGMLLLFNRRIKLRLSLKSHGKMFILSLLNVTIFMEFWFLGETSVSSSLSSIIIYTYPIISTFLSIILLKEKYTMEGIGGIALGFTGIIVIFSDSINVASVYGIFLELLAATSWALGTIFYKKYIREEDRITTNFYQFAYSLIPVIFISFISTSPGKILNPGTEFLMLSLVIGIPGTAIAYYFFLKLNRDYNVSTISSFLFIVPALSVIFSYFILHNVLTYIQTSGFLLVSIGILLSARGVRRKKSLLNSMITLE